MARTKPKALGTSWETDVVRYTRAQLGDELSDAVLGLLVEGGVE